MAQATHVSVALPDALVAMLRPLEVEVLLVPIAWDGTNGSPPALLPSLLLHSCNLTLWDFLSIPAQLMDVRFATTACARGKSWS